MGTEATATGHSSSGAAGVTSGAHATSDSKPSTQTQSTQDTQEPEHVPYTTYKKAVTEKRNTAEALAEARRQLDEFQAEKKKREEDDLKAKEDWKKMFETREQELAEERNKRQMLETTLQEGMKLDAFLKAINGRVSDEFMPLIRLDDIAIDPQTGRPDPSSVHSAARSFESKYGRVIDRPGGAQLPNGAPHAGNGLLTFEQWSKLPLKEKKARLHEVMKNN
jgi:hypothetical protein